MYTCRVAELRHCIELVVCIDLYTHSLNSTLLYTYLQLDAMSPEQVCVIVHIVFTEMWDVRWE